MSLHSYIFLVLAAAKMTSLLFLVTNSKTTGLDLSDAPLWTLKIVSKYLGSIGTSMNITIFFKNFRNILLSVSRYHTFLNAASALVVTMDLVTREPLAQNFSCRNSLFQIVGMFSTIIVYVCCEVLIFVNFIYRASGKIRVSKIRKSHLSWIRPGKYHSAPENRKLNTICHEGHHILALVIYWLVHHKQP